MRKVLGALVIAYGLTLSTYFAYWAIKDNTALENAVRLESATKLNYGIASMSGLSESGFYYVKK